jgi:hypothetical protein
MSCSNFFDAQMLVHVTNKVARLSKREFGFETPILR